MARMLGKVRPPWCPHCKASPGPDCPDNSRSPKQVRRAEQQALLTEMVEEAARYGLYEATATPRPTR